MINTVYQEDDQEKKTRDMTTARRITEDKPEMTIRVALFPVPARRFEELFGANS